MQIVEPEKALSGCCSGISAAVACFRTCWELKLACRKGLWTEPFRPSFCSSGSWGEVWVAVILCAHGRPLCPCPGTLCENKKISRIFLSPAFSKLNGFQKSQSKSKCLLPFTIFVLV